MSWPLENSMIVHFVGRKVKDLKDRRGTIISVDTSYWPELGYDHMVWVVFEGQEGVGAQRVALDNLEILE